MNPENASPEVEEPVVDPNGPDSVPEEPGTEVVEGDTDTEEGERYDGGEIPSE